MCSIQLDIFSKKKVLKIGFNVFVLLFPIMEKNSLDGTGYKVIIQKFSVITFFAR